MTSDPKTSQDPIPTATVETTASFTPCFDKDGLIPAIATDTHSGEVLMFAWMNADALMKTIETGYAHFWSRSRKTLWLKGEESSNLLAVQEIRTDCDQDVIWLRVEVKGHGKACHTGARTCFYRILRQEPTTTGNTMTLHRVHDTSRS